MRTRCSRNHKSSRLRSKVHIKDMLDVIFRSCDHSDVHPERGRRFIDVDRPTLVKKCFKSLLTSVKASEYDAKIWIVDDGSSDATIDFMVDSCKSADVPMELSRLSEGGYNASALRQFEMCRDHGRKWVYSVEDDYLHESEAIKSMVEHAESMSFRFGRHVAIRPDDDVFTYSHNTTYSRSPCMIVMGKDRHWRTLHSTHNTFMTHVDVFKEYWELFASLAKFFRKTTVNEDGTINTIWSDGASKDGPVPLFSPIPTLAIHISQNNQPHLIDYMRLWDSMEID